MLNKLLNEYSEFLVNSEGRSYEKTVSKYIKFIKESFKYLNIKTVEDINDLNYIEIRENYLNVKRDIEGLSSQSLNLRLVANKSFGNYLKGRKIIAYNAYEDVKRYKIKQTEKVIDPRDIQAMIEEARLDFEENKNFLTMRNYFILSLAIGTGLRSDEMRSIKMNDINFTTGVFTTTGKYSKSREIKLNKELLSLYHEYLYYRNQINTEEDYLLVSKNGKHMYSANLNDVFKKYGARIGIDNMHTHLFRHGFGTALIESGVPIEKVSKLMGHSNMTTCFSFYYHPQTSDDDVWDNNPFFKKDNKKIKDNIINKVK